MFVIQDLETGLYFHAKGKIILFDTPEIADTFKQMFFSYAVSRFLEAGEPPFAAMNKQATVQVLPFDFTVEEKYLIKFSEIEK